MYEEAARSTTITESNEPLDEARDGDEVRVNEDRDGHILASTSTIPLDGEGRSVSAIESTYHHDQRGDGVRDLQYPTSHPRINWKCAELRHILSDYRERGIGSTREVAARIAEITGVYVSHSTISRQSKSLTDRSSRSRRSHRNEALIEHGMGIAEYRQRASSDYEDGGSVSPTSNYHPIHNLRSERRVRLPMIAGRSASLRAPSQTPYYMSFSERFKQTSLTVHMSADEVRIYRHTSHSRDGRSIYFRCSKCDNINRKLRTGITPRIKMVDGVVVGNLFPGHHPRCEPMTVVAARALEIERRCRKDIINGMDPKEAWEKGRLAAIAESASLGSSSFYGPGTVLAAFPNWEKCKHLYCTLRAKTLRRRLRNEFFDPQRIAIDDPERPDSHAPRNGVDEISQFDVSEPPRPKRPRFTHNIDYNVLMPSNGERGEDEYGGFIGEDEIAGNELDEDFMDEELDEEIYEKKVDQAVDENIEILEGEEEVITPLSSSKGDRYASTASEEDNTSVGVEEHIITNSEDTICDDDMLLQAEPLILRGRIPTSVTDAVDADVSDGVDGETNQRKRSMRLRRQAASYGHTEVIFEPRRLQELEPSSASSRPRRTIRRSRKLSPTPRTSGLSSPRTPFVTIKRSTVVKPNRKELKEYNEDKQSRPINCVNVVSPAGMIPVSIKRDEKFTNGEAAEKLRQIERLITEYNSRSDDKLTSILVRRNGRMKMYGSKALIAASLRSSLWQSLRNAVDREELFEDDKVMSLPLMKIRSESEVDAMHGAKMRPLLSDFIVHAHFPYPHSFVANRAPAYWPSDVRYCDPNKEDIKFTNISRRPHYRLFSSVVEGQRYVLKYAYQYYREFLLEHFKISSVPGFESDLHVKEYCGSRDDAANDIDLSASGCAEPSPERGSISRCLYERNVEAQRVAIHRSH
uniref:RYYR-CCHC domain-containing protein n=1 Tax=Parascaris univalens TaxID=6257 RepID=A0A914ZLE2_PARUN